MLSIDDLEAVARSSFTIGAAGALITASPRFLPGASWPERAWNVFSGTMVAGYVSPEINAWLGVEQGGLGDSAAFVFGAFGMSLMAAALQAIKDAPLARIIGDWFIRRGGG